MEMYKVLIMILFFVAESSCNKKNENNEDLSKHPYKSLITFNGLDDKLAIYDDFNLIVLYDGEYLIDNFTNRTGNTFGIIFYKDQDWIKILVNPKISFIKDRVVYHGRGIPHTSSIKEAPVCNFTFFLDEGFHVSMKTNEKVICNRIEFMDLDEFSKKIFGVKNQ
jgi:hypothetical protein